MSKIGTRPQFFKLFLPLVIFCIFLTYLQPAFAAKSQDIKNQEEMVDIVLTIISKGQVLASVCSKTFQQTSLIAGYSKKFNDAAKKPFSSAISVKLFLDEEAPEFTGPKLEENNILAYPVVAKASLEIMKAIALFEKDGVLEAACEQMVTDQRGLNLLETQMPIFFQRLEKLDAYFPGFSDFIKARHFEVKDLVAGHWTPAFTSGIRDEYFFNVKSVEIGKSDRTINILNNYGSPNQGANSVINRVKFDCSGKRFQVLTEKYYTQHFAEGQMIQKFDTPMPWYDAPLDSSWYILLLKTCEMK